MTGVSDTIFDPGSTVTRAMFVTMLASIAGYDRAAYIGNGGFSDVSENDWYAPAVIWAKENAITEGYGGTFGANDPVTREQMVVMIRSFAEMTGTYDGNSSDLRYFKDYMKIDDWAKEALGWAVCHSLISGTSPGILSPQGISTRAQAAVVLNKFTDMIQTGKH